jgi:hypothetical protein
LELGVVRLPGGFQSLALEAFHVPLPVFHWYVVLAGVATSST